MTDTTPRRGIDRRTLLKYSAAGSAALASGSVFTPAIAQQKPIKIGFVSPQTGPLAAFAEADNFVLGQVREATKGGIKSGNTTRPIEVIVKDSQSGFRAFRRNAAQSLELRATGMEFASEMLILAARAGWRIREVPMHYGARLGKSKLHALADGWRITVGKQSMGHFFHTTQSRGKSS